MNGDADVVVVGAGVMGLATARALARPGRAVVVLEQFVVGHARGSSHGSARIFKVAYPQAEFVDMAMTTLPLWRELEAESGEELVSQTGSLDVGDVDRRRRALVRCGARFELLRGADIERRYGIAVDREAAALFQADGGVLHADRAQRAFLAGARAGGVEVAENTAVRRLVVDGPRVRVQTSAGQIRARAVVVTAGPWSRGLVEPVGIALDAVATRETVAYFRPRVADATPPLSDWRPAPKGEVTYGLVARDGLLKVGVHRSGTAADPDEVGRVDEDVVGYAAAWAARRFELEEDAPARAETCLYTNLPDDRFVLQRWGRVVLGSACSGHGFKFAPLIGRRLAALALEATR